MERSKGYEPSRVPIYDKIQFLRFLIIIYQHKIQIMMVGDDIIFYRT